MYNNNLIIQLTFNDLDQFRFILSRIAFSLSHSLSRYVISIFKIYFSPRFNSHYN